jgi:multidrug efflux pump subunit AcrA (membrane-fusion protein)
MSETVSRGRDTSQRENTGPQVDAVAAREPRRRGSGRWIALGIVVVVAAGAVSAWRAGVFSPAAKSGAAVQGAPPPATQPVVQQEIAQVTSVNATLGYAGSYTVTGQGSGTLTSLPQAGQVISQGQVLYETDNGSPVVLMYGSVPAWRTMDEGLTGADVSQLNHDLVALGDASSSEISSLGWDYYSWETQAGVQKLEENLGVSNPSGSLSLGQVVFEPEALRIAQLSGRLGGPASGPVLVATSDRHVVSVPLDATDQAEVKKGDKVSITLPDGVVTPGVITSVGTVASGTAGSATIPVTVTMTHPSAAGTLDQAAVTVYITTATAPNALAVPVTALVAQSSGGYVVEVVGPGNSRRYVPVTVGIFDDATGMVQVTGALTPGEQVVVAAS